MSSIVNLFNLYRLQMIGPLYRSQSFDGQSPGDQSVPWVGGGALAADSVNPPVPPDIPGAISWSVPPSPSDHAAKHTDVKRKHLGE